MKKLKLAIVDVETTGAKSISDRIIEIAVLKVEDGKIVKSFQSLINPEMFLPHGITGITGITDSDLVDAPTFLDVIDEVSSLLEGSIFVAHNVSFDYGFVKNEFKRAGREYKAECLCTVKLSRALFPRRKRHNLDSLIEYENFKCENRHRAYDDAFVLFQFLEKQNQKLGDNKLEEIIETVRKTRRLPPNISPKTILDLPQETGVYIFKDERGEPLYVGKSINIKNRVLSHFSAKERDEKEFTLSLLTHDIEAIETSGELGALLLESKLVKELLPLYNRLLRHERNLLTVKAKKDKAGFYVPIYGNDSEEELKDGVLGLFRSKKQLEDTLRKMAKEYSLCEKLLGLSKGGGPCFYSQIERCKGACSGKELPFEYNKRFLAAFEKRKIQSWPYNGSIMINERKSDYKGEAHIVDNWKLIRTVSYDEYGEEKITEYNNTFDYDSYKILARYILNSKNWKNIKPYRAQNSIYSLEEKVIS